MADKEIMNKTSSISFTLPISCQVCLGKVKQPVVCPNYHAFCSTCIELWLQHNQQCPACRIPITPENPCKQVLGGPSFSEDSSESTPVVSTPALRRTRLDLLYKEYEDEIERLTSEVDLVKSQNAELEKQLSQAQQAGSSTSSPSCKGMKLKGKDVKDDVDVMMVLTSKLKEATSTYEKVKRDMDKMKEVNFRLRDENSSLLAETGRLKQLVALRSPKKYEKYAMSAQASKIDSCEKEIKVLRKALDRSDIYTEELENTVAAYKEKYGEIMVESDRPELESTEISILAREEVIVETASGDASRIGRRRRRSSGKATRVKQEVFDDEDEENDGSSFQLEQPSPVTPATSLQRLTLESSIKSEAGATSSSSGSSTSTASSSSLRSCTRQLDFSFQNDAGTSHTEPQQISIISIPDIEEDSNNTPTNLDSTFSNLDYSITPEFEACAKLLKAAEQRVHQRKQSSLEESEIASQAGTSSHGVDYKSSYILQDCDPTFTTSTTALTGELKFAPQRQRPPSAPAASLLYSDAGASSFQSALLPNTVITNTRPNSAPLDSVQSLQVLQRQPQIYSSNMSAQPTSSALLSVQNPTRTHSYSITLESGNQGASSGLSTPHVSQQSTGKSRAQPTAQPVQSKTVYVLSGSRIGQLGDRRKRSSESERRGLRSSSLTCSPSKTQKL